MLKSPSKAYQSSFADTKASKSTSGGHASYTPSLQTKSPMSDSDAEQYIRLIFEKSPKSYSGTAPAHEWLEFLDRFNEQQNYYILTELQKRAIKPYCDMNQDLEMTPEEFISLVFLIRHDEGQQQQQQRKEETKRLLDSRPRSSKLLLSSSKSTMSYFDDRASTNHPDSSMRYDDRASRNLEYHNDNNDQSLLKNLKREKNIATRQLKEHESRIASLSREHSERLTQLQTRLENMKIEADQQKATVAEYKNKERERLDKIAELKSMVDDYESKYTSTLKKLQKKTDQVEELKEKLSSMQESHSIATTRADAELYQLKKDHHAKLDQEKRLVIELKHELEQQQNEHMKLMELIDKQKFDLDEARRYYAPMDNQQAEYQDKLEKAEQDLAASIQIQEKQKTRIQALSNQFDQQHALIDSIRSSLNRPCYISKAFSWIAYAFTLYHVLLLIISLFMYYQNIQQLPSLFSFSFLHDWEEYFYSHVNRPSF